MILTKCPHLSDVRLTSVLKLSPQSARREAHFPNPREVILKKRGSKQRAYPKFYILGAGDIAEVGLKDLGATFNVWIWNRYVAVKSSRPHKRLVQRFREVGCCHHNNALIGLEPRQEVPFCQSPLHQFTVQDTWVNAHNGLASLVVHM